MKCPKCRVGLVLSPYFDSCVYCPVCKNTLTTERIKGFWEGYNQAKKELKVKGKKSVNK